MLADLAFALAAGLLAAAGVLMCAAISGSF